MIQTIVCVGGWGVHKIIYLWLINHFLWIGSDTIDQPLPVVADPINHIQWPHIESTMNREWYDGSTTSVAADPINHFRWPQIQSTMDREWYDRSTKSGSRRSNQPLPVAADPINHRSGVIRSIKLLRPRGITNRSMDPLIEQGMNGWLPVELSIE
jgi:hypothetical protein